MSRLIVNQQELAKWVREQKDVLDIAVAFWGLGASDELGLSIKGRKGRIILNISSGGSNPDEVRKIRDANPTNVKCLDRLHAKAFVADREAIIGSANASANGLGSEGTDATRWHELGLISNEPAIVDQIKSWFENQWKISKPITDSILSEAAIKWKLRQRNRPLNQAVASTSLLEAVLKNPSDFSGRNVFVQVSTRDLTPKGKRLQEKQEEETQNVAYGFEDWSDMPIDAKLICFTEDEEDGFQWDDPQVFHTRKDRQSTYMKWIDPTNLNDLVPGVKLKLGSIKEWKKLLQKAKKEIGSKKWKADEGLCIDLGDFVHRYGQ